MVNGPTRKEPHEIPPEIRALGWDIQPTWSEDGQRVTFDLYSPLPRRGASREYDWAGSFVFVRFEKGGQIEGLTLTAEEGERAKILAAIFSAGASAGAEKCEEPRRYGSGKKKMKRI